MQVPSVAQSGLLQALSRFDASAQRVARSGAVGNVDLPAEAVEQVQAAHAVTANISTLKTADQMVRRLLDIKV